MHIAYSTPKYKCSYICRMPHVESTESTEVDHKTLNDKLHGISNLYCRFMEVYLWKQTEGRTMPSGDRRT